ncbi:MAG TPA: metallophosphoesterase [Kofleriaceae bacterium]|nr:metallophosphoesterase [Kofleriaceae bacterium]
MPDTQYYLGEHQKIFEKQATWLADQRDALNIKFVIHLGDMTNNNTIGEWRVVDRVMKHLDGVVPYSSMPGNHDGIRRGITNSVNYNQFFGIDRFAGRDYYGGHFGDTNDSNYSFFDIGGMEFMVLSLAFGTPQEQLDWANEVLAQHPDKRTIFATHTYLDDDGTRLDRNEEYGVEDPLMRWNDGTQIWDKVLRRHANLFMTVCGHVPGETYFTSRGDADNVVHEIMANYQGWPNGGDGYLRILRFSPATDKIHVIAYSPWLDRTLDHPAHSFVLDYEMPDPR